MSNQNNQGNTGAQQQQAPKASPWKVWDSNQRGDLPRVHDIITKLYDDGRDPEMKSYKLFSSEEKPCEMPAEHAMKFLCDHAFVVHGPNGNRVMPVAKFDPSKPITQLKDDELIVKYSELSRESLLKRVKLTPGSEAIQMNAQPDELAAFLVTWRKSLAGLSEGDRALAEKIAANGLEGTMDEKGLDGMFGDRKAA